MPIRREVSLGSRLGGGNNFRMSLSFFSECVGMKRLILHSRTSASAEESTFN